LEKVGFWEVLESRRSVRRFKPQPVEREIIERLLGAGVRAPNAHNNQSWRFAVLTEKADMARLVDAMRPDYEQALLDSRMDAATAAELADRRGARLTGAPLAVIICVAQDDLKSYDDETRSRGEELMAVQSAALAGGHILLAAQALGLGGVWMCAPMFVPEIVQTALDLPANWAAQGMLLLGYPDEAPELRPRKPIEEVVRWVS